MPKIVDHEERRAHIIEAVTKIIARDGFDHVTMRGIAQEAGYAHGALSRYFPNKQSLLTAVFLRVFEESHEHTIEFAKQFRGLEALTHVALELLPYEGVREEQSRVVLIFWARAVQDPELKEMHYQNLLRRRELFRSILIDAQELGEMDPNIDLEVAVNKVTTYIAGWQMLGVFVRESATAAQLEASVHDLVESLKDTNYVMRPT